MESYITFKQCISVTRKVSEEKQTTPGSRNQAKELAMIPEIQEPF
jgi:hypothetical protein